MRRDPHRSARRMNRVARNWGEQDDFRQWAEAQGLSLEITNHSQHWQIRGHVADVTVRIDWWPSTSKVFRDGAYLALGIHSTEDLKRAIVDAYGLDEDA